MSNWFEDNPTKSVVAHTVIVAAATWAAFYFVFDENKVKLIEAKSEKIAAESKEVSARNSVLVTRLDYLTKENEKYLRWLESTPNTLPFYQLEITKLEDKITKLKSELATIPKGRNPFKRPVPDDYEFQSRVGVGSSFIDPKTRAVLGIQKIDIDRFAIVQITLPDGKSISVEEAKPGQNWPFHLAGKRYTLLLESLDWPAQRVTVKVYENPSK